ncbi:MAG TPA: nickel insertion protein, partial [Thermoleophilia bacterium]|nr:nickel insertion protein [Thermoleophilia bacterium]
GRLEAELDRVELLETNIDDASPEVLAHAAEELRRRGALDVWMTQALMKKGRPGVVLHVLCRPETRAELAAVVFAETTTFGVRVSEVGRLYLEDRWATETVHGHEVRVRLGFLRGRPVVASAEYEDCASVAAAAGVPVSEVMAAAQDRARRRFAGG